MSKDINLRLKAKSLNINAEDYLTGRVEDTEKLFTGKATIDNLDDAVIAELYQNGVCHPKDVGLTNLNNNLYLILKGQKSSALAFYRKSKNIIERIDKTTCYRITPRNSEQAFALHAILNEEVNPFP